VEAFFNHPVPARARDLCCRAAARLRQERGFTLIEVIVAGALLAVVTAGVYAGIDGPARISGTAKARAAANNIAQADQERMRAMRFADLQNYAPTPTTQVVDGVTFTLASRTDWINDRDAAPGCTVPNDQGDYLRLNSTVSWSGGGQGNPVSVTSLMAPPVSDTSNGTGDLIMHLKDQTGAPVAGIPVTLTGRTTLTKTTDAGGCAVFAAVPSGNYTASMNQAGWTDDSNVQNVSIPAPIRAGETAELEHLYARSVAIRVTSFTGSDNTALTTNKFTVSGGALSAPRTFTGAAPLTTNTPLYPATTGNYVVSAGACASATPADGVVATPLAAGGTFSTSLRVPTLTIRASSTTLPGTPRLVLKPSDPACDTYPVTGPTNTGGQYIWTSRLPMGTYSLCAEISGSSTSTPFLLPNHVATGTDVTLALTGTAPSYTGVTATPNDGSPVQTRTIANVPCP
jgi:prepilin-type N-terminal cleavage/methylation domain-containing protein